MCRTPPNQVADHAVISIAHPRIRCRYGGAYPTNKFIRISPGQRLPIWFPVEAIEFYTRQFKRGSDARGHCCLPGTRGPDYHDSHLPLAHSCDRGYPIARQGLNVSSWHSFTVGGIRPARKLSRGKPAVHAGGASRKHHGPGTGGGRTCRPHPTPVQSTRYHQERLERGLGALLTYEGVPFLGANMNNVPIRS